MLTYLVLMRDFTCYETKTRFYIVGSNSAKDVFRIAKIDKTISAEVSITDDHVNYTAQQIQELLGMISHGNKSKIS